MTEALCGKAAGAAITVLGRLRQDESTDAPSADRAPNELWGAVDRRHVLKRIGQALGRNDAEIAKRVLDAKRAKTLAKADRINPRPEERTKAPAEVIDEDRTARLRHQGFDERSRRTFRRHHPDRTEVVTISDAAGEIRLGFGVGFPSGVRSPEVEAR